MIIFKTNWQSFFPLLENVGKGKSIDKFIDDDDQSANNDQEPNRFDVDNEDGNAGLRKVESDFQDWIKDLTLPENLSKANSKKILSLKSNKLKIDPSLKKVSGEKVEEKRDRKLRGLSVQKQDEYDRKLMELSVERNAQKLKDVSGQEEEEDVERDYVVINDGEFPDDDDYVDLNGPNENDENDEIQTGSDEFQTGNEEFEIEN